MGESDRFEKLNRRGERPRFVDQIDESLQGRKRGVTIPSGVVLISVPQNQNRLISNSTQSFRLSDGRLLGFQSLGGDTHKVLFFFHGSPGSRLALAEDDLIVRSLGVRVIIPDRPGYGISDPKPGRSLIDWPRDVIELADHLLIDRFAVAGESGGGPHALACAFSCPDRVTVTLLLASPAPACFNNATRGMCLSNRIGLILNRRAPWLANWLIRQSVSTFQQNPQRYFASMAKEVAAPDKALLETEHFQNAILRDFREAYKQGAAGHISDAPLSLSRSWGFDLSAISVPVLLCQGELDTLVTTDMARYLDRQLPKSQCYFVPQAGHFLTEHSGVIERMRAALLMSSG